MKAEAAEYYKDRTLIEYSPNNPKLRLAMLELLVQFNIDGHELDDYIELVTRTNDKFVEELLAESEDPTLPLDIDEGEKVKTESWMQGYL